MENIFKIVERKRNHWEEHKYNSNKEIACFSLDGKYIKTFENIKQAAYEYFTSVSIISKCIKNNKPFRGIIYWKRI